MTEQNKETTFFKVLVFTQTSFGRTEARTKRNSIEASVVQILNVIFMYVFQFKSRAVSKSLRYNRNQNDTKSELKHRTDKSMKINRKIKENL